MNLEFNCIGTTLVGFGFGKTGRERAGLEITEKIQRFSSLGKNAIDFQEGDFTWTLTLIIPLSAFFRHQISDLSGLTAKANFYKCGDELSNPHYISWRPIDFAKPNFHLPEFFGDIVFT
ncbi:MAG: hypothetical protein HC905_31345 [Bacteroidales bacterium]|nr:hypothetical protein [Bacteroidales bacterium]